MPLNKKKIIIISSGYPYGLKETFLHNEVLYLSKHFEIEIFPILKKQNDVVKLALPSAVTYYDPILQTSYLKRIAKGLFNRSPILPYIKDLKFIFKNPAFFKNKVTQWFLNLLIFRTFFASEHFKKIQSSPAETLYFYWGTMPVELFKNLEKRIFVRIHGNEVDLPRNYGYIPLLNYRITNKNSVQYLPISLQAANNISRIKNVNYLVNRLGVYDQKLNPRPLDNDIIRIVSCSNLIPLKRVHLIIEALKLVDNQIEWVHFGDGPLMDEMVMAIQRLPSNINAKFLGRVENKYIMEYYSMNYVDAFINVSSVEGIPVSIMEAFSFGIPSFATDVGGTNEIVNNKNGYLASQNFNLNELANFIIGLRNNNKLSLRHHARKTFEAMCNAEKNYKELVEILNQQANK